MDTDRPGSKKDIVRQAMARFDAELNGLEQDETTKTHKIEELIETEVRKRQPSNPFVVIAQPPEHHRHDSSEPPSNRVEITTVFGGVSASGAKAVVVVLVLAALVAIAWLAGRAHAPLPMPSAVPAGHS